MGNLFNKCHSNKILPIDLENTLNRGDCAICLEGFTKYDIKILECKCSNKIRFHKKCINTWLAHNNTCPICRQEIELNIIRNLKINEYPTEMVRESIGLIFEAMLQNIEEENIIAIMKDNLEPEIIKNTIMKIQNYLNSNNFISDIENEKINLQINYNDLLVS